MYKYREDDNLNYKEIEEFMNMPLVELEAFIEKQEQEVKKRIESISQN